MPNSLFSLGDLTKILYEFLKHFVDGKIKGWEDEEEYLSSYCRTLSKKDDTGIERGITRWHSLDKSLSKILGTDLKTDNVLNAFLMCEMWGFQWCSKRLQSAGVLLCVICHLLQSCYLLINKSIWIYPYPHFKVFEISYCKGGHIFLDLVWKA
jgi:hypothetical protein